MNEKRRRANALMMKYYSGMIDEGSWKTAAGDIAVFNTKYRRDLKSLTVQLEPIQAGSGDPSPDNIRQISGWTGATVYQNNGNNYLNLKLFADTYPGMCSYNESTGELTLTSPTGILYTTGIEVDIPIFEMAGCYFSADIVCEATLNFRFRFVRDDGTIIQSSGSQEETYTTTYTFPRTGHIKSIRFNWSGTPQTVIIKNAIMAPGQTAVPYTPYTGAIIPVSWETEAGTVYGGTVDIVSGVLKVNMAGIDMGSLDWVYQSASGNMYAENAVPNRQVYGRSICSMYKYAGTGFPGVAALTDNNAYGFQYNLTNRVIARDTAYTDATTFKSAVTGQRLIYELATPQTYQLTSQQIQTLIGENVIWSDAGAVSVEYWS